MSKRPKHLQPEEVREEWREYFFYDRQEVHDYPNHRRLDVLAKCPRCFTRHWVLSSDVRAGRRSPYCPLHKWVVGGLRRRRPLKPEEVPADWHPCLDFDNQDSIKGNLHIQATCPDCGHCRWVPTNHLRSGYVKSPLCYICNTTGGNHPQWRGGRHIRHGYAWVLTSILPPEERDLFGIMAASSGYIAEHRLVIARKLRRPLHKGEIVHHLNGVKDDNRVENLRLLRVGTHHPGHGDDYYQKWQETLAENERLQATIRELGSQSAPAHYGQKLHPV